MPDLSRRDLLGASAGAAFVSGLAPRKAPALLQSQTALRPAMVGSANALPGMKEAWPGLLEGGDPLDMVIDTVKLTESDPHDTSVGLGGLPNEDGAVALDAACMYGPTHNSGAVAAIENILHPSEVARLVMERTDHCLLVGEGAYRFARQHGHPHTELLTERARKIWLRWKESMSDRDDRLAPPEVEDDRSGALRRDADLRLAAADDPLSPGFVRHGTIHCSAVAPGGAIACTTTTSGLAFKIPGRVGDSPIIGAGLYCDQEAGSAGSTGRGEAAILANGSFAIVELMRQGMAPQDAGLELLRRIVRQVERQATWQPGLLEKPGRPAFGVNFYIVDRRGRWAGVTLKGEKKFAVADPEGGVRLESCVSLLD